MHFLTLSTCHAFHNLVNLSRISQWLKWPPNNSRKQCDVSACRTQIKQLAYLLSYLSTCHASHDIVYLSRISQPCQPVTHFTAFSTYHAFQNFVYLSRTSWPCSLSRISWPCLSVFQRQKRWIRSGHSSWNRAGTRRNTCASCASASSDRLTIASSSRSRFSCPTTWPLNPSWSAPVAL